MPNHIKHFTPAYQDRQYLVCIHAYIPMKYRSLICYTLNFKDHLSPLQNILYQSLDSCLDR